MKEKIEQAIYEKLEELYISETSSDFKFNLKVENFIVEVYVEFVIDYVDGAFYSHETPIDSYPFVEQANLIDLFINDENDDVNKQISNEDNLWIKNNIEGWLDNKLNMWL